MTKFIFDKILTNEEKFKLKDSVYLHIKNLLAQNIDFDVSFKTIHSQRTNSQNNGYWRLCGILLPYVKKDYPELNDSDAISDLIKLNAGYTTKTARQFVPKSLTLATKEDMNELIKQAYHICEFYKIANYELTSYENLAMIEYFESQNSQFSTDKTIS